MTTMITDMVEVALDRLLIQFKEAPLVRGLVELIVSQVQEVEQELNEMISSRTLWDGEELDGVGQTLDLWGGLLGEKRGSLSDADFIRFIVVRIARNSSSGTAEQLITILQRLTQADEVTLREHRSASISFEFKGGDLGSLSLGELGQIIQSSMGAGVQLSGIVQEHPNPFKLDTPGQGLDLGQLSRLV